jgi:hypothetical protein
MSGRALLEQPLSTSSVLDGSDLAEGCYLLVASDGEATETLKIIKI